MIVISEALALAQIAAANADFPVVGWHNLVTVDNVAADSEDADYPASNLANPSTTPRQGWRGASTAVQYVTVTVAGEPDYLAIARHNFGSAQITVSVEAEIDSGWTEVVEEFIPADDSPILARFVETAGTGFRLKLQPSGTAPRAAVLYVGNLLVFERGVQVHTPINYGRRREIVTGRSHSGDYLGRIVTSSTLQTQADINMLSPSFYRAEVDDFFAASAETPFFFAWSPERYPTEVGFAWLTNDPVPQTAHLAGYINVSLQMEGIA